MSTIRIDPHFLEALRANASRLEALGLSIDSNGHLCGALVLDPDDLSAIAAKILIEAGERPRFAFYPSAPHYGLAKDPRAAPIARATRAIGAFEHLDKDPDGRAVRLGYDPTIGSWTVTHNGRAWAGPLGAALHALGDLVAGETIEASPSNMLPLEEERAKVERFLAGEPSGIVVS